MILPVDIKDEIIVQEGVYRIDSAARAAGEAFCETGVVGRFTMVMNLDSNHHQ
jgi:hypothetical protein